MSFKTNFQNVDQHTGGKWIIHGTKQRNIFSNVLNKEVSSSKVWRCYDSKSCLNHKNKFVSRAHYLSLLFDRTYELHMQIFISISLYDYTPLDLEYTKSEITREIYLWVVSLRKHIHMCKCVSMTIWENRGLHPSDSLRPSDAYMVGPKLISEPMLGYW